MNKSEYNDFYNRFYTDKEESHIIYNSSKFTKIDSKYCYANLLNIDSDKACEVFENGNKSNSEILDNYLKLISSNSFTNKLLIIILNSEEEYDEWVLILHKLNMFIDYNRTKYKNIVVPIFEKSELPIDIDYLGYSFQKKIFNLDSNYSLSKILDDKFSTNGVLTKEGHKTFAIKLNEFIMQSCLNEIFEKRDDMKIEIFDIEQELFKVVNSEQREEFESEKGTLNDKVQELSFANERLQRELFRESSMRTMANKKIEIQKNIINNNYPDEFKKFKQMEKKIVSLQNSNTDLHDIVAKLTSENSDLQELNPKRPII